MTSKLGAIIRLKSYKYLEPHLKVFNPSRVLVSGLYGYNYNPLISVLKANKYSYFDLDTYIKKEALKANVTNFNSLYKFGKPASFVSDILGKVENLMATKDKFAVKSSMFGYPMYRKLYRTLNKPSFIYVKGDGLASRLFSNNLINEINVNKESQYPVVNKNFVKMVKENPDSKKDLTSKLSDKVKSMNNTNYKLFKNAGINMVVIS